MNGNIKFSVPDNYVITDEHGVKGLVRVSEKVKPVVILDKENAFVAVTKSYGRIYIVYQTMAEAAEGYMSLHLAKLNLEEEFSGIIGDIKVGEDCIFANIYNKKSGNMEWVRVNKDFGIDGIFGQINFTDQFLADSIYIPIGVKYLNVEKGGVAMTLDIEHNALITGNVKQVAAEMAARKERKDTEKEDKKRKLKNEEPAYTEFVTVKRPTEEPLHSYDIDIDENGIITGLNSNNGVKVIGGSAIGEAIQFTPIIKTMVGGDMKLVDKEVGEAFFKVLSKIEHYGHGIVLAVLHRYVNSMWNPTWGEKNDVNVLKAMYRELTNDWEEVGERKMKFYSSGSVIIAMLQNSEGRAIVAPYQVLANDSVIGAIGIAALKEAYVANGDKVSRLRIWASSGMDQQVPKDYIMPICVSFRKGLIKDIRNYTYDGIDWYAFTLKPEFAGSTKTFQMCMNLAHGFKYLSNKRINGKHSKDVVRTNLVSLAFVEPYTDEELAELAE